MIARRTGREFLRFVAVGLANTATGLGLIYAGRALGMGEVAANACGYALGGLLSFALNRQWTFDHRGAWLASATKFLLVVLAAWLTNLATLLELMRWGIAAAFAQAIAVVPYTLVSFVGCRQWVFPRHSASRKEGPR